MMWLSFGRSKLRPGGGFAGGVRASRFLETLESPLSQKNALSPISKTWKRAPHWHRVAQGVLLHPQNFKLHLEECTIFFPSQNVIFPDKCPILSCFWHILAIFCVSVKSLLEHLGETALQKSQSYEYRHQSDTVCHNIFDSYTYDSTRHHLNIPQIDKTMPWHQT